MSLEQFRPFRPNGGSPQDELPLWDAVYRRPQSSTNDASQLIKKPSSDDVGNCFIPSGPEHYPAIDEKRARRRLRDRFDDFLTSMRRFVRSLVPRGSETLLDEDEPDAPGVPNPPGSSGETQPPVRPPERQPSEVPPLGFGIYADAPNVVTNEFGMTQYTYANGDSIVYTPNGDAVFASVGGTLYQRLQGNLWNVQRAGSDKWEEMLGTLQHEGNDNFSTIRFVQYEQTPAPTPVPNPVIPEILPPHLLNPGLPNSNPDQPIV